ncbi:MAG: DUF3108 domain-containing protein [Gammaproteobacteria bacterium]|nr:DUF3108 domain-containing protein [Gammaproteobacteria bacterium]
MPADTLTLELEYDVFIRGVRVGEARIHAETGGGGYRVCGTMQTTDVWSRVVPWEARFAVRGRIEEARAVPEEFRMHERARKKRSRLIHVAGDVLRQVRDGEAQDDQPAPEGVDIMSFFWVTARCDDEPLLNNGRKTYPMVLREHAVADDGTERCDYDVLRDDGKRSPARFDIVERHGRRVPKTVTMPATLRRQLRLVDASVVEEASGEAADACSLPDFEGARHRFARRGRQVPMDCS